MCMCNFMTILDLVLQISYYKVSKKLNKCVLIWNKVIYATEMGKYTSFFPFNNKSAKNL